MKQSSITTPIIQPGSITSKKSMDLGSVFLYEGQEIPVVGSYAGFDEIEYYEVKKDILLYEGHNFYKFDLKVGDKIFFDIASPVNSHPESSNSYNLCRLARNEQETGKNINILSLIPVTCEGGLLTDFDKHYDAITQIKNIHLIINGQHETEVECRKRALRLTENYIPDGVFYTAKPFNASNGFEWKQKNALLNNIYIRYHAVDTDRVVDMYKTKADLAWDIYMNARVMCGEKDTKLNDLWNIQYDKLQADLIATYKEK